MLTTAQALFRELEAGKWKPFYLVSGDEPFQTAEILAKLKAHFVPTEADAEFRFESWEGEGVDGHKLLSALEMMPGLFDGPDAIRLVVCRRFDKVSASALETLEAYFKNPSPTTCFVMAAAKVDKRKAWYKAIDERGSIVEVSEPYDREWPKWQGYFEKKIGKKIDPEAWETLLETSNRLLAVLWTEVQKAATYVGEAGRITQADAALLSSASTTADLFAFAEDVVGKKRGPAIAKLHRLVRSGESEIKLLSILVRQFRQTSQCATLMSQGVGDSKVLATRLGVPPFIVGKIQIQAKKHKLEDYPAIFQYLADCDYRLKTGGGSLFETFLVPYFSGH